MQINHLYYLLLLLLMGCVKMKKINFNKKSNQIKKTLLISLIVTMLVTAFTPVVPVVLALPHSDVITVTFDPGGDISINASPETAAFGAVVFSTKTNAPTTYPGNTDYTVFNNGSAGADVYIFQNATTESQTMAADTSFPLDLDEYGINITGTEAIVIPLTNGTLWEDNLAASASITFGFNLDLGAGSLDHAAQNTWVNITAVVNT